MIDENTIMMIVWLSIFVVALVAELATTALVSVWFCIGALVALSVTYIPGMPWWGEMIVFLGVSALFLAFLRPITNKLLLRRNPKTNVAVIIGRKGIVTKDITEFEYGEVKVSGTYWTGMLAEGEKELKKDTPIVVMGIEGNKLIVKELLKKESNK